MDINNFTYEILRQSFKPTKVKVLFIAESPPPDKRRTFFYLAKSFVYNYTKQAACRVYGESINKDPDFLYFFKDKGCYLEDLSSLPSNIKEIKENKEYYIVNLSEKIKKDSPQSIIIIGIEAGKIIKEAVELSGILDKIENDLIFEVPFAGNGSQNKYMDGVEAALRKLISEGILD